jgi:hypothetical protein
VIRATIASRSRRGGLGAAGVEGGRRRVFQVKLDRLGRRLVGQFGSEREAEIDARGHAAAGDQVAVAHHAPLRRDRPEGGEQIVRRPVRSGPLAPQEPGRAEHQGAGADGGEIALPLRLAAQEAEGLGILHQRVHSAAARHADHVERRAFGEVDRRRQHQAGGGRDRLRGLRHEMDAGARHHCQHLVGTGQVELLHPGKDEEADLDRHVPHPGPYPALRKT